MTANEYAFQKNCSRSKARADLEAMVSAGRARKVTAFERSGYKTQWNKPVKVVRYEMREAA